MGQVLHKRATTTHAIREAIQQSTESLAKLAKKYSINKKTVAKWKHRTEVEDKPMGRHQSLTVIKPEHEAAIVAMRTTTWLSTDDLYIALKDEMPELTPSNLYRCLARNGVSQRPEEEKQPREKKLFKEYDIGYIHIDTAEIRIQGERIYLFVGIDRTSKFAFARLYRNKTRDSALDFLQLLKAKIPYPMKFILTDNGIEYTDVATNRGVASGVHPFDQFCARHNIEHRLTKVRHPWTNGQVERMNRTIKDATIKAFHYDSFDQLQGHLALYVKAYNCAKRLKALKFKTPLEFVTERFLNSPILFEQNPTHYYTDEYN